MALGKEYFKKIKNLCRGPWIWALGKGPNPKSASGPHSLPTEKKIFAEGLAWPSAKGIFAEGLANGPRQRKLKKIKNLCRGPSLALGKGGHCRGLGQWPSAKKI